MDPKTELLPRAQLTIQAHSITRTDVTNDWGLRLEWCIFKDGKIVAAIPARTALSYEHPDKSPGLYEIVLRMWKYVDYRKKPDGEYVNSKFIEISNKISYRI